jgi:hypothetical protein
MPELPNSDGGIIAIAAVFLVLGILGILRIKQDYGLMEIAGFTFGVVATGFVVWAILDLVYDFVGLGPIWPFSS